MGDICESCGCPEDVAGHDLLYREIDTLRDKVSLARKAIEAMRSFMGMRGRMKPAMDALENWDKSVKEDSEPLGSAGLYGHDCGQPTCGGPEDHPESPKKGTASSHPDWKRQTWEKIDRQGRKE